MWWLLVVFALLCVAVLLGRSRASSRPTPGSPSGSRRPQAASPPRRNDREAETAQMLRRIDADAAALMPAIDEEAAKFEEDAAAHVLSVDLHAATSTWPRPPEASEPTLRKARGANGGPSWMSAEDWEGRLVAYRKQGRSPAEITEVAAYLERRGPRSRTRPEGAPVPRRPDGSVTGGGHEGMVVREDFVAKENEAPHLTRDENRLPALRLVDAGDRLSVWSPLDGGALINPKGPGLRQLGLYSSSVRGANYHRSEYRSADLRMGRWVDLVRQPDNPHDANAVMICSPCSRTPLGYVQRGRAPAVARRMDAGEDLAGVCLRGPGRGSDDGTAWMLIGSRVDLTAMLES